MLGKVKGASESEHMRSQSLQIRVVKRVDGSVLNGSVHSSRRALDQARKETPQVCLLDIGLPGIDGNDFAQRRHAMPETAHALLIAATGYGQEQGRKQTMAAGLDHHLAKPVDTKRLAAIIAEVGRV